MYEKRRKKQQRRKTSINFWVFIEFGLIIFHRFLITSHTHTLKEEDQNQQEDDDKDEDYEINLI